MSGMGDGYVGTAQDAVRIRRLEKQREAERKKIQELKNKNAKGQSGLLQFGSSSSEILETAFKKETVGLVTREQYVEKRVNIRTKIEEEEKEKLQKLQQEEDELQLQKLKKRKIKANPRLSFSEDFENGEEEDAEDKNKESNMFGRRGFGKDPTVETSFLPDSEREAEEQAERERLRKQWLREQEQIKNEALEITYSYWDGAGHRRVMQVRKGDTIGEFLRAVQQQLAPEFREVRTTSVENLLYVKEDLIIPHQHSFYDLIVNKARNRVTLIVGETGCGKSSQVPQFLLEENIEPILCTQPRRFAVVAVAKMVAKARNCIAGGEVGYHIGHSRVMSASSKIIFKTAGVLLEELREKGMNALRYKVIILDEVHERSVESDLVLVCVKQFLIKNSGLRVVLMSATADITRYKEYFGDLGRDERVEVLGIPSSSQHTLYQRRVSYLEKVVELLEMSSEYLSTKYCFGPSPDSSEAVMNEEVHKLIHNLVLHIHKNEPDMEKSILIFLPTYHALEQQWLALRRFSSAFKIHILHSSIDTEQALKAMRISKTHRKVILATNIAESSVTIPKVAYVIDSCRSLQVYWDANRKNESSEIVWVSESQAEQRRGRTGRTCDGEVYRLVTESFFGQLEKYETPAILKLSLRQQVLLTTCAESRAINDPKVLLQKVMDPPRPDVVDDALDFLVHIKALERTSPRGRYEPTFYGRLLSSFSLSLDASMLILKFGEAGMLREGIIMGILMDTQPLPIIRPFGQEALFSKFTDDYYNQEGKITGLMGRKEVTYMANLCAFQFWQRTFQDNVRLERLKHLLKFNEKTDTQILSLKIEEEWCLFHNLLQSALQHIANIYESVLNSVHRYRPSFLATSDGLPAYYEPYEFQHTCLLTIEHNEDSDPLATDDDLSNPIYATDDDSNPIYATKKCITRPFVDANGFNKKEVAFRLANSIKEIRINYMENVSGNQLISQPYNGLEASICRFFASGTCNKGSECLYSHSLEARRPACKFFLSLQGCRNGSSCFFSHTDHASLPNNRQALCVAEDLVPEAPLLLRLFPSPYDGCILIFDDFDMQFSANFAQFYEPSSIVLTTSAVKYSVEPSLQDLRIIWGLSHPHGTIISKAANNSIPWKKIKSAIWIPKFSNDIENWEEQKGLLKTFFEYLAIRILGDSLYEVQVILVMNNIRFAQLQVESLARENFFFLRESFAFDEYSFGKLSDDVNTKKPMMGSKAIVYAFGLHPPTDIQFGDYTSVLHKQLYSII